jgi:Family of unknown function (DUF6252)
MINRDRPFLAGSLLVLVVASCASDSSSNDTVDAGIRDAPVTVSDSGSVIATGTLRADIDGAEWTATTAGATFSQGVLGIGGQDNAGRIIAIGVEATIPGTYTVDGNEANCTLTEGTDVWIALGQTGSGSVTLTVLTSTSATGTFQFVAAHATGSGADKIIGNGSFELTFGGAH